MLHALVLHLYFYDRWLRPVSLGSKFGDKRSGPGCAVTIVIVALTGLYKPVTEGWSC